MKISHEYCQSIFYFFPRNALFLKNPKAFPFKQEEITVRLLFFIRGHVVFNVLPFLLTLPRSYDLGKKGFAKPLLQARKLSLREESSLPESRWAGSREQTLCHLLLT